MRTADTQLVLAFEIERAKADAKADAEERRVIDEYVQAKVVESDGFAVGTQTMNGKGDKRRPSHVSSDRVRANWDGINWSKNCTDSRLMVDGTHEVRKNAHIYSLSKDQISLNNTVIQTPRSTEYPCLTSRAHA